MQRRGGSALAKTFKYISSQQIRFWSLKKRISCTLSTWLACNTWLVNQLPFAAWYDYYSGRFASSAGVPRKPVHEISAAYSFVIILKQTLHWKNCILASIVSIRCLNMLLMNLSERSLRLSRFSRGIRSATSFVTRGLIVVKSSLHWSIVELKLGTK